MRWGRLVVAVLLLSEAVGWGAGEARGQGAAAAAVPQTGLAGEFGSLASRAAVIFVGQVVSIVRRSGAVEINFTVEQAILGAPGTQYTLREWAGLWPQGQFRYTVGQRALVFLHAGSAAGFGSPVDGAEGVVPVVVQGANAPELLDVRRLSAALLRPVGTPLASEAGDAIQLSEALSLIAAGLRQATATGMPRPEPVRLPMPVHSGIGGVRGTTGAGAGGPSPATPRERGSAPRALISSESESLRGPAAMHPVVASALNRTGAGVLYVSR